MKTILMPRRSPGNQFQVFKGCLNEPTNIKCHVGSVRSISGRGHQPAASILNKGFDASLTEAATWFAPSHPAMGAILVGMATPQQFEDACRGSKKAVAAGASDRRSVLQVQPKEPGIPRAMV